MTTTITPYRTDAPTGRDGFAQLVHGEWTKFRTVRGWLIASVAASLVIGLFGALAGLGSHSSYGSTPENPEGIVGHPYVPIGPDGEAVTDSFSFVHRSLDGDGSITARVGPLTASAANLGAVLAGQALPPSSTADVQPWTKAGLIIKASTSQGAAYAAIMITGGHGVRMQDNFTDDIAGPAAPVSTTSPQWLRLARTGDTITGYSSTDGSAWTTVGTVHLAGLPASVPAGPFVASPDKRIFREHQQLGGGSSIGGPTIATATFGGLDLQGHWASGSWTATAVGADASGADGALLAKVDGFREADGTYTVTGTGDIAPDVGQSGQSVEHTLTGAFGALIVLVVLGVLFITTEYRRGLIRTSLTVSPRRGRVLVAKAVVVGTVAFVTGLVGAAIAVPLGEHLLRNNGNFINPISFLTEVRVIAGTAALLAVAAVLAVAVGTIVRRSAAAIAIVVAVVVLPYILATSGALPDAASEWLLRLSPAAGFAIQQSIPAAPQVDLSYTPIAGFYPLAPWAGLAVLCAWAALAVGAAAYVLRRRDA